MRRLSDDELGALAAAGERRAFALIFERYHQPLYRYCLGIVRDTELAADALQNTMIGALRGLEESVRPIALRPWLYRIAHNQSVSLMRRTRVTTSVDTLMAVPGGVDPSVRERLQELVRDLQSLPEQQRSALLLRELNGLDYDEVALALSVNENAARQAVFKARQALHTTVAGRTERCETIQASMSAHDRRFQRRRDIRAHLDDCPDCTAFAAGLATRAADLPLLFPALPAAAAAAILSSAAPASDDSDHRRRRGVVFLALLGLALASTAVALAASGVFSSGGGGGGPAKRSAAAAPSESPSGGPHSSKAPRHSHAGRSRHHHGAAGRGASGGGSAALEPVASAGVPSAQSGYATPGALTETAVSGGCASSSSRGGGSGGGGEGGSGSGGAGSPGGGGGSTAGSGGGTSASAPGCGGSGGGGLPLTGLALVAVLASALALLSGGFALRRLSS